MNIKLKTGQIINIQFQQYEIGLYVCIYDKKTGRMIEQKVCLDITKDQFINDVMAGKVFNGKIIK